MNIRGLVSLVITVMALFSCAERASAPRVSSLPANAGDAFFPRCRLERPQPEAGRHVVSVQFDARTSLLYQVGTSEAEGVAPQSQRYCFQGRAEVVTVHFLTSWQPGGLHVYPYLAHESGGMTHDPSHLETPISVQVDGQEVEIQRFCYDHPRIMMRVCEFRFRDPT